MELRNNSYPNCSSLARHFEVSTKSIQRDIEFMRDMLNAPIDYDVHKKGYFYRSSWHFNPTDFLDDQELEALSVTSRALAQYQGAPYYDEICRALDKLTRYLPNVEDRDCLLGIYSFGNPVYTAPLNQQIFTLLEQAVRHRRTIAVIYNSLSAQTVLELTLHPYRLHYVHSTGAWHCIAYCQERQSIAAFAVRSMQAVSITGSTFAIAESFNIESYLKTTFEGASSPDLYDIVIRFTPYQSRWIRGRSWHPTQSAEEHDDGSLTLTFRVGALAAVKRWLMRYGAEAEVLAPPELRQMVACEVQQMAERYGLYEKRSGGQSGSHDW